MEDFEAKRDALSKAIEDKANEVTLESLKDELDLVKGICFQLLTMMQAVYNEDSIKKRAAADVDKYEYDQKFYWDWYNKTTHAKPFLKNVTP